MAGVNKVILVGHLGGDPEMKYLANGDGVCTFSVATSEQWKDKGGQKQERTEWHRCVAWRKTAELCAKYLSKGRQVYIEGKIQTRSWDDKDGKKKYATEIVVDSVQFLGGGKGERAGGDGPAAPDTGGGYGDPPDGDIPFATCDLDAEPSPIARLLRGMP